MLTDSFGFSLIFLLILLFAVPLGLYLKRVYHGDRTLLDFFAPFEERVFRICRIEANKPMDWIQYLSALLTIQLVWIAPALIVLMLQGRLPLNPAHVTGMEWSLALNSVISFLTSTNLQHYAGESGASYLSQIAVFTFLQFVSAATSLAAGVAIVRGLAKQPGTCVGNFFKDFLRSITRVLLPLSIVVGILFMIKGVPMTFKGADRIITLQGDTVNVARGPVASMIPIKELGSNGGGFFGANDAHPFENPDFVILVLHFVIVLLLPMAFVFFIGYYLNEKKFSWMLFGVMTAGLLMLSIPIVKQEAAGNPKIAAMGISQSAGNMEGKEVRFGTRYSAFYCAENVAVPAGTTVSVHDSYMPLSATAMLAGMQVDAFFGGLGTGWINMLMYLIIAVFVGTLMIGRTPEFFGKKISTKEMQVAVMVNVLQIFVPVALAATSCFIYVNKTGGSYTLGWLSNKGAHGFTTMLYEYVSSVAGNGSNFGGLGNNTVFWNLTTAFAMLTGRFVPIAGAFMIIGLMRAKKYTPPSLGTLRTDSATFGVFLFSIIIVLTVLTLFVMFMVGPITEYFNLKT